MHTVSHSLAKQAHQAPPATWTWVCWLQYNAIQPLSARSSPAGYLHILASSVSSASPTPPQALAICETDHLHNIIITPSVVSQTPRELPTHGVQKIKYVIGFVGEPKILSVAPVSVVFGDWEFNFWPNIFRPSCQVFMQHMASLNDIVLCYGDWCQVQ
jgi:hypothetical protein